MLSWVVKILAEVAFTIGLETLGVALLRRTKAPLRVAIGLRTFDLMYRFDRQIAASQEIHAAWLSGKGMLVPGTPVSDNADKIKRLILPNPQSGTIAALSRAYEEFLPIAGDIERSLKRAKKLGIDVAQYPGFWGIEMTIGDPDSDNGWAHCSCHVPGQSEEQRLFYRVEKKRDPKQFRALVGAFDIMWREAKLEAELAAAKGETERLTEAARVLPFHNVLYDIQVLFVDISEAVNGAVRLVEDTPAGVLSGDEVREDVLACKRSFDSLARLLSESGGEDDVQDGVHRLYVDYQRVRKWIADSNRRNANFLDGERAFVWYEADGRFLGTLTRLMYMDPFARLASNLQFYNGPDPQFGLVKLPPASGMTASKLVLGVLDNPTPSTPDNEARPHRESEGERP